MGLQTRMRPHQRQHCQPHETVLFCLTQRKALQFCHTNIFFIIKKQPQCNCYKLSHIISMCLSYISTSWSSQYCSACSDNHCLHVSGLLGVYGGEGYGNLSQQSSGQKEEYTLGRSSGHPKAHTFNQLQHSPQIHPILVNSAQPRNFITATLLTNYCRLLRVSTTHSSLWCKTLSHMSTKSWHC